MNSISGINVVVFHGNHEINYFVFYRDGSAQRFTEKTIPRGLADAMNRKKPRHVSKTASATIFYYIFI